MFRRENVIIQDKKQYFLSASIGITSRCNSNCIFCDIHKKSQIEELELDYIKRILKILNKRVFILSFTGGEPLLHPDINKILFYSKKISKVNINTNGINSDILYDNIKNIDFIHLSVNSLDELQNKYNNIQIAKKNNKKVIINTVIHKKNLKSDFMKELIINTDNVLIDFMPVYINRLSGNNHDLILKGDLYDVFIQKIKSLKLKYPDRILNSWKNINYLENSTPVKCLAYKNSFYLHYTKKIYNCSTALVKGLYLKKPENLISILSERNYIKCKKCRCSHFLDLHYLARLDPLTILNSLKSLLF